MSINNEANENSKINPTRKTKAAKKGRPTIDEQKIKDLENKKRLADLEKQELSKVMDENYEQIKALLDITLNDSLLGRLPDDLKNAGCKELDEAELDRVTKVLVPVLDRLGWLGQLDNPYVGLGWVTYSVFKPRVDAYLSWKKK